MKRWQVAIDSPETLVMVMGEKSMEYRYYAPSDPPIDWDGQLRNLPASPLRYSGAAIRARFDTALQRAAQQMRESPAMVMYTKARQHGVRTLHALATAHYLGADADTIAQPVRTLDEIPPIKD